MKKVFIYAYMARNLGDDLMVSILCNRYPDVQFFLYAESFYKTAFKNIKNLTVYSPEDKEVRFWNKTKGIFSKSKNGFMEKLMKSCDATVHIGGSVFIQHNDDYSDFLKADQNLRLLSKKMFLIGSNFGPYKDENYYKDYYQLLSKYDGVSFRDHYSYDKFKNLPNVVYAPDVVFNYENINVEAPVKHRVLFSTISMAGRTDNFAIVHYWEKYRKFVQKLARAYIEKGYDIAFLSFCEPQGDLYEMNQIVSEDEVLKNLNDRIKIFNYNGNLYESISLIQESEIIVGTRFHSIILGWLFNKPVLPIVYDNKTLHVLEDMHYDNFVTLDAMETVNIEKIIENTEKIEESVIQELKLKAKNHFQKLDEFLNK